MELQVGDWTLKWVRYGMFSQWSDLKIMSDMMMHGLSGGRKSFYMQDAPI